MLTIITLSLVGYRAALYAVRHHAPEGKARDLALRVMGGGGSGPIKPQ